MPSIDFFTSMAARRERRVRHVARGTAKWCAVALIAVGCRTAAAMQEQGSPSDVTSLDRIRRGLAVERPLRIAASRSDVRGRPIFQSRVDELQPRNFQLTWDPATYEAVPADVRPSIPGSHYEFLRMVTPEEFRGSTLYAGGVDVLSLLRTIRGGTIEQRRRREQEERRRIKEELAALKKSQDIP
jgi:hypothetical protein